MPDSGDDDGPIVHKVVLTTGITLSGIKSAVIAFMDSLSSDNPLKAEIEAKLAEAEAEAQE
jgi:hypothetical protein